MQPVAAPHALVDPLRWMPLASAGSHIATESHTRLTADSDAGAGSAAAAASAAGATGAGSAAAAAAAAGGAAAAAAAAGDPSKHTNLACVDWWRFLIS